MATNITARTVVEATATKTRILVGFLPAVLRYRFHLEKRGLAPGTITYQWRPCDGRLTRRLTPDY